MNQEEKIISLIDNKKGDLDRLNEILSRVRSGKTLYNSDINYIEKLSITTKQDMEKPQPKLLNSKSPISESKPILISNKKSITTKNIPNVNWPYAVSYNTSHSDEVKIHAGSCAHVARASNIGPTKWIFTENLKEAVMTAHKIYSKYGSWRFPRCCLYNGASCFECKNCSRYSDGTGNTKKKHVNRIRYLGLCMIFLPIIHFFFFPYLPFMNYQIFPFISILLFFIGILVLIIENATTKRVCKNCDSTEWKRLV